MNDSIAFGERIDPGGLRTVNDVKLLLVYIISKYNSILKKEQLIENISSTGVTNYFILVSALDELISEGSVFFSKDDNLLLSECTMQDIKSIENELPFSVKQKSLNSVSDYQLIKKREKENPVLIEEISNGFNVTLSFLDEKDIIMKITLYAADYDQANQIRNKFLSDPVRVYSGVVSLFLD